MSSRARQARQLAQQLSARTGVAVSVSWHQPRWLVEWTDGPCVSAMRGHTVDAPAQLREALRMRRDLSPAALAAGLLLMARAGELPTTPRLAVLGLDTFFDDLDAADWADLLPTAQALAHHWGGEEHRMATAVLASHHGHEPAPPPPGRDPGHEPTSRDETPTAPPSAAPPSAAPPAQRHTLSQPQARDETALVPAPAPTLAPRDETSPAAVSPHRQAQCGRCGTVLPAPASTGRPRRWCSPACRQAAHRRRAARPRYETPSQPALFATPRTCEETR